jgi:hypothetical protein
MPVDDGRRSSTLLCVVPSVVVSANMNEPASSAATPIVYSGVR